jgi:hypothetical protein
VLSMLAGRGVASCEPKPTWLLLTSYLTVRGGLPQSSGSLFPLPRRWPRRCRRYDDTGFVGFALFSSFFRKPTPISRNFSISRREIDPTHKSAIAKFQRVPCENVAISPPISQLTAAQPPVTPRESSADDCGGLTITAEQCE